MNILWHYFRSLESSVLHHPHQIFPFSPLSLSASCHAIFYARLSILLRNANAFRLSSPREVILLEREDRSQLFCSESYFSCKRKHWRMKVLFPENDRSQTQFTRNRVSRGKLVKVAKLFAFYFRGYRYRFLVIIIVGTQHDVITRFPSHFYYSFSRSLRSAIFSSPSSSVSPIM